MRARQLEVFCAVMRLGTVTAAAEALNISQPALSQILRHAEDELGFPLFRRVRGRLAPTDEAEELYPEAARLFAQLEALRRRTEDMRRGRRGLVRFAASPPPSLSLVAPALERFRAAHPEMVVRFHIAPVEVLQRLVLEREIGFAMAMTDVAEAGIELEVVGSAGMVCVMPAGHPLAARDRVDFAALHGLPLISYRYDTRPGRALIGAALAEDAAFAPAIEIDLSISALPMVQQGLGVAVVDDLLPWTGFPGIVTRPFVPAIRLPIAFLTAQDRPLSSAHGEMRDLLRAACADREGAPPPVAG